MADPDEGSDDGRLVSYDDDEDEAVPVRQPRMRARSSLSSAPPRQAVRPASISSVVVVSDGESEAGPSRIRPRDPRDTAVVEVPFLPFHELQEYHLPRGMTLPTTESRRRVIAEQHGKLALTPSKRKRERSLSSDSGFGGYGDDTDDLHDEGESEIEAWESDGASSDGVACRTRQSGRSREEAPVQTRSQPVSRPSSVLHYAFELTTFFLQLLTSS